MFTSSFTSLPVTGDSTHVSEYLITQTDCAQAYSDLVNSPHNFDPPYHRTISSVAAIITKLCAESVSNDSEINEVLVLCDDSSTIKIVGFVKLCLAIAEDECEIWITADSSNENYAQVLSFGLESGMQRAKVNLRILDKEFTKFRMFVPPVNLIYQRVAQEKQFVNFYESRIFRKEFVDTEAATLDPSRDECTQKFASLGLELRPFNFERDGMALYAAEERAFRHHGQSPSASTFESWISQGNIDSPDFDSTLWFVLWDQDTVVGAAMNEDHTSSTAGEVLISTVFISESYGGKGIGKWLMWAAFAGLRSMKDGDGTPKFTHARLSVDANDPKANGLYKGVGMSQVWGNLWFERVLTKDD